MFISDESDFSDIFSEPERDEFIYRIFKHICLGGSVCQVKFPFSTLDISTNSAKIEEEQGFKTMICIRSSSLYFCFRFKVSFTCSN